MSAFTEFEAMIDYFKLCVTETWLTNKQQENFVQMQDYSFTNNNRKTSKGGGVAIYVNDRLGYKERKDVIKLDETIEY